MFKVSTRKNILDYSFAFVKKRNMGNTSSFNVV